MRKLYFQQICNHFEEASQYSKDLATWDASKTASIQLKKLQSVWEDCVSDVPYYQALVSKGKAPEKIQSWNDFFAIPILDRLTLKENQEEFRRLSGPPDIYVSTAGSTSQPVSLGQWRRESDALRVAKLVPWIRAGYYFNSPLYLIWGHSHLLGTGWRRYWNHSVRKIKDWFLNYHRVDAYTIDPQKAVKIAQEIIKFRPTGIIGYAAILDLLARYTEDYHSQLRMSGVKFILSCAEPPPRADTFDLLRKIFGCSILQEFGGVDYGHVAMKTDNEPFLVFPNLNIIETDNSHFESDEAPAIVTTLYKRYTPLIRYQQGDLIGGFQKQAHGHVFQFNNLVGRVNDIVHLNDGTAVHSVGIIHCFKDENTIYNVQMVLRDTGTRFRLVVRNKPDFQVENRIRTRLNQIHSSLKSSAFDYVTDLSTNRAGKRRWFADERSSTSSTKLLK